jgi:hypothetical protein
VDTKNAGTKTTFDTVQLIYGNDGAQPHWYDDLYVDMGPNSTFKGPITVPPAPPGPPTSTDPGWHKITAYSAPNLAAPTNLRMNPADPNNHSTFPVAWDWSQPANGLTPNFHVVLTNEAGSWLQDYVVGNATRTYTFSGLSQNTRYRAYVCATYPGGGRPDTAFIGPLNWAIGADAYTVNDVPVYGWGGEFEYLPPYYYTYSSAANGDNSTWGFGKAIDNNFSSYWNSDIVSEANGDANQGEGWMVQPPAGNYLFNGIRLWNFNPTTCWLGVSLNGNWQGGLTPYVGKYAGWRIPYVAGVGPQNNFDVRSPTQYNTNGVTTFIAGLMQNPGYDGYNWRITLVELRLLLQQWVQTGWGPRTVPAVNSAAY